MTQAKDQPRWIEYRRLSEIESAFRNAKRHDLEAIAESYRRFGVVEAPMIDERTGRLVAGHGRLATLLLAAETGEPAPDGVRVSDDGEWLAPVQRGWSSEDDEEAEAYLIGSNQIAIRGGWDDEVLAEMLGELGGDDPAGGLLGTGFAEDDLLAMMASSMDEPDLYDPPDDDDVPDRIVAERVSNGDVWQLGEHRVMCGDCRDPDHVVLLMDGATVNLGVTSPPYAEQREYDEASGFRPIKPADYVAWFESVQANVAAHLAADGSWLVNIKPSAESLDTDLYVFDLVIAHVRKWGWHFATEFCWERIGVPKAPTMRLKNQFEPVYQFTRGRWKFRPDHVRHKSDAAIMPIGAGAGNTSWDGSGDRPGQGRGAFFSPDQLVKKSKSNADRQGSTSDDWYAGQHHRGWAYPGNRLPSFVGSHEATGHSAAYPVGLPDFFIRLMTDEDDVVFDPFLGSGSSILAAHRTGRVGLGMELSRAYCDIVLDRWERHTGIPPVKVVG